jgi:hypothetical protein
MGRRVHETPTPETRYEVKCPTGHFYTPSLDLAIRYARCNKGMAILRIVEERTTLPVPLRSRRAAPAIELRKAKGKTVAEGKTKPKQKGG